MATRVTFVSGTAEVKRREKRDAVVEEPIMRAAQSHVTGSRGNPYHTLQLDRHGRPVVEEMVEASSSPMTGDRGNPYYSRSLDDRGDDGLESVTPAQPMNYVDGKCSCCPYGYHIDLDFVNFCQDVSDGSTLTDLKRIQRAKRKLRKSMEVMLHQQQHQQHGDSATATLTSSSTPPPDVVHSTEASRLINMVQYEQSASHQVLRHIDSSVNATLAGGGGRGPPHTQRYTSSDSDEGYIYGPVSPVSPQSPPYNTLTTPSHQHTTPSPRRYTAHHHHYHPSNGDESSHLATSLSTSGRTDSMSSLSSVSTVSSEQVTGQYTAHASGMLNTQPHETATAEIRVRSEATRHHTTSATAMTVEKLAATMATHFPHGDRLDGAESPSSPISPNATISKASLAAIREAMAVSLQRMRELEEQVKAIPILQVRISVLKEEKRLLALQLKAKSTSTSVRSIGVGEESVYSPLTVSTSAFSYPSVSSPFAPMAASPRSPSRVRTVGVGDHSVVEPYLLQPQLPTGYTITDNLVQTEIRSREMLMKERQLSNLTVSTDHTLHTTPGFQERLEARSPVQTHFTINQIQRSSPRPLTRSIGVGEGNVLDSSLQIHEKELRTVIIGGSGAPTGKRNVGVEVRVPTRSVGVSYSCDDARPATRTVGVNVNYDTSGILTTLDFKGESELRTALRGVLQRNVRSMGIQCSFQAPVVHTGVQHESFNAVSVGCGGEDCRVDVEIRLPVTRRSLGIMAKPEVSNRMAYTDKDWVLDQGTNTVSVETYNKGCSTEIRRMGTVATNTLRLAQRELATQTDSHVFQNLQAIKTIGVNTTPTPTSNRASNTLSALTVSRGVNTKAPELTTENFDIDISFDNKGVNTPKQSMDTGINTNSKELQLSFTKVECIDVPGEAGEAMVSPKRELSMQEQIIQRGASQASAFIGSTSSSDSISPTSPRSLTENDETVSRTMKETVYTSPATFRQVWTSQGSPQQSEVFRSGRESRLTMSDGGQEAVNLGGESGGGYSRSTVTRTVTSSTHGGDRISREDQGIGDIGSGSSGGGGSYRSTITRTVSGSSDDGNQSDISGGGVNRSMVTRTISSGGGGSQDDGDAGDFGGGRVSRSVVTRTITTRGGTGYRLTGDDADQDSNISRTVTTHEGNVGGGFSSSLGGGEGMQKSTYTKTFISTGGIGGGLNTAGRSSQESKTSSDGDSGSGFSSNSSSSSTVTKTISSSGSVRREQDTDEQDSALSEREGDDRNSFAETVTHRGSPGHIDRTGPSIKSKTITIRRTMRGSSPNRSTISSSSMSGSGGLHSENSYHYIDGKKIAAKDVPEGGTGYLERFGYSRTSNQSSTGGGSLQTQQTTHHSSMETSTESQNSGTSSDAGSFHTSGYSSQETEGEGGTMEVVQGRAVLQAAMSEPSLQGGQVTLVGGSSSSSSNQGTSQNLAFTSGSLQDMTSGGEGMMTESVVIKRSSSGGHLSKKRHSDGGRLSRELDMQGAFSGRRVGSVEDFMPDNVRRFMNIETTGSKSKARSGGGKADRLLTKTVKTVTTKRTTQDGKSKVSITRTVTNPDGTVTTITDDGEDLPESATLGHLSSARMDLSKMVSEESGSPVDPQESSNRQGRKGSGSQDCAEDSEDLDFSGMGTLERRELKSIMKRSRSDSASGKKGISFADSVVGGTGSSSEVSDDESTTSYDEGSYDGREGDITFQCCDDQAIAQGLPGATMYDQNIRETSIQAMRQAQGRYELSGDMQQACQVLANYLMDSTTIQTKELNTNRAVVQEEWFRVSSHKLSSVHQVEDYLSSINEISPRLLDYIVNLVDSNGNAAIHYCVSHCNFDIAGLLLDTNVCDVRRPNKAGYTPAMLASLAHVQNEGHRHIILRLFSVSDINARADQTGQTALMLATSQCRADMVQLLLEAGADCNIQDFDGSTALMCASEHGHAAIAQLLLAQPGCDGNIADNENSTALSIAMEAGHKDIGVILYKHLNFSKTASPHLDASVRTETPLTSSEDSRFSDASSKGHHSRDRGVKRSGRRQSRFVATHSRSPASAAAATARSVQASFQRHSNTSSSSAIFSQFHPRH